MPAVSAYDPAFNLRTAYAVQHALVERLYHGKPVGGYKAVLTAAARTSCPSLPWQSGSSMWSRALMP